MTLRQVQYVKRYSTDSRLLDDLEKEYEELERIFAPTWHTNGFAHPYIPVITNERPFKIQAIRWGLIPFWVKDAEQAIQIQKRLINARGETIFEKPSFRDAAKYKRCLMIVDGFYEHHHHDGKAFPFHITRIDGMPFSLAGLWSEWLDKQSGELIRTCTLVTTRANELMKLIHNNPKQKQARMPVILEPEEEKIWLSEHFDEKLKTTIQSLIKPNINKILKASQVHSLRGRNAFGNSPEAVQMVDLEEKIELSLDN